MARIRTIKPDFWKHEQLGRLSFGARLTFVGLWSLADDEGRGRADTEHLWGQLHSYTPLSTKALWKRILSELKAVKDDRGPLVIFYKAAGAAYYWIPGFKRQQRIDEPSPSKFPPPPNSGNVPGSVPDDSSLERRQEGSKERKGEEGDGKTPPPVEEPGKKAPETEAEEREIDRTVAAFAFCNTPGVPAKANAIRDLRRLGISHEFIRSIAGKQEQKPFYDIIRSLEKGKAKPEFKASPPAPKACRRCSGLGKVADLEKSTPEKGVYKPCPDCGPPPAPAQAVG